MGRNGGTGKEGRLRRLPILVPIVASSGWVLWLSLQFDLQRWFADRSLVGTSAGDAVSLLLVAVLPVGLSLVLSGAWIHLIRVLRRPAPGADQRDPLTGLPNRAQLHHRLCQALAESRVSGEKVAVLFLDLDRFKKVNDGYGHEVGDELLVTVARRLGEVVRRSDMLARVGGDEFVVVCPELTSACDAEGVAERLALALSAPFFLSADRQFPVTASIGIALADGQATPESLLREADAAMYRAKERGRAGYVTWRPAARPSSGTATATRSPWR